MEEDDSCFDIKPWYQGPDYQSAFNINLSQPIFTIKDSIHQSILRTLPFSPVYAASTFSVDGPVRLDNVDQHIRVRSEMVAPTQHVMPNKLESRVKNHHHYLENNRKAGDYPYKDPKSTFKNDNDDENEECDGNDEDDDAEEDEECDDEDEIDEEDCDEDAVEVDDNEKCWSYGTTGTKPGERPCRDPAKSPQSQCINPCVNESNEDETDEECTEEDDEPSSTEDEKSKEATPEEKEFDELHHECPHLSKDELKIICRKYKRYDKKSHVKRARSKIIVADCRDDTHENGGKDKVNKERHEKEAEYSCNESDEYDEVDDDEEEEETPTKEKECECNIDLEHDREEEDTDTYYGLERPCKAVPNFEPTKKEQATECHLETLPRDYSRYEERYCKDTDREVFYKISPKLSWGKSSLCHYEDSDSDQNCDEGHKNKNNKEDVSVECKKSTHSIINDVDVIYFDDNPVREIKIKRISKKPERPITLEYDKNVSSDEELPYFDSNKGKKSVIVSQEFCPHVYYAPNTNNNNLFKVEDEEGSYYDHGDHKLDITPQVKTENTVVTDSVDYTGFCFGQRDIETKESCPRTEQVDISDFYTAYNINHHNTFAINDVPRAADTSTVPKNPLKVIESQDKYKAYGHTCEEEIGGRYFNTTDISSGDKVKSDTIPGASSHDPISSYPMFRNMDRIDGPAKIESSLHSFLSHRMRASSVEQHPRNKKTVHLTSSHFEHCKRVFESLKQRAFGDDFEDYFESCITANPEEQPQIKVLNTEDKPTVEHNMSSILSKMDKDVKLDQKVEHNMSSILSKMDKDIKLDQKVEHNMSSNLSKMDKDVKLDQKVEHNMASILSKMDKDIKLDQKVEHNMSSILSKMDKDVKLDQKVEHNMSSILTKTDKGVKLDQKSNSKQGFMSDLFGIISKSGTRIDQNSAIESPTSQLADQIKIPHANVQEFDKKNFNFGRYKGKRSENVFGKIKRGKLKVKTEDTGKRKPRYAKSFVETLQTNIDEMQFMRNNIRLNTTLTNHELKEGEIEIKNNGYITKCGKLLNRTVTGNTIVPVYNVKCDDLMINESGDTVKNLASNGGFSFSSYKAKRSRTNQMKSNLTSRAKLQNMPLQRNVSDTTRNKSLQELHDSVNTVNNMNNRTADVFEDNQAELVGNGDVHGPIKTIGKSEETKFTDSIPGLCENNEKSLIETATTTSFDSNINYGPVVSQSVCRDQQTSVEQIRTISLLKSSISAILIPSLIDSIRNEKQEIVSPHGKAILTGKKKSSNVVNPSKINTGNNTVNLDGINDSKVFVKPIEGSEILNDHNDTQINSLTSEECKEVDKQAGQHDKKSSVKTGMMDSQICATPSTENPLESKINELNKSIKLEETVRTAAEDTTSIDSRRTESVDLQKGIERRTSSAKNSTIPEDSSGFGKKRNPFYKAGALSRASNVTKEDMTKETKQTDHSTNRHQFLANVNKVKNHNRQMPFLHNRIPGDTKTPRKMCNKRKALKVMHVVVNNENRNVNCGNDEEDDTVCKLQNVSNIMFTDNQQAAQERVEMAAINGGQTLIQGEKPTTKIIIDRFLLEETKVPDITPDLVSYEIAEFRNGPKHQIGHLNTGQHPKTEYISSITQKEISRNENFKSDTFKSGVYNRLRMPGHEDKNEEDVKLACNFTNNDTINNDQEKYIFSNTYGVKEPTVKHNRGSSQKSTSSKTKGKLKDFNECKPEMGPSVREENRTLKTIEENISQRLQNSDRSTSKLMEPTSNVSNINDEKSETTKAHKYIFQRLENSERPVWKLTEPISDVSHINDEKSEKLTQQKQQHVGQRLQNSERSTWKSTEPASDVAYDEKRETIKQDGSANYKIPESGDTILFFDRNKFLPCTNVNLFSDDNEDDKDCNSRGVEMFFGGSSYSGCDSFGYSAQDEDMAGASYLDSFSDRRNQIRNPADIMYTAVKGVQENIVETTNNDCLISKLSSPPEIIASTWGKADEFVDNGYEETLGNYCSADRFYSSRNQDGKAWKLADMYVEREPEKKQDNDCWSNTLYSTVRRDGATRKKGDSYPENRSDESTNDENCWSNTLYSSGKKDDCSWKTGDMCPDKRSNEGTNDENCWSNKLYSPVIKDDRTWKIADQQLEIRNNEITNDENCWSNTLFSSSDRHHGKTWKMADTNVENVTEESKVNDCLSNNLNSSVLTSGRTLKITDAHHETLAEEIKDTECLGIKIQCPLMNAVKTWQMGDTQTESAIEEIKDKVNPINNLQSPIITPGKTCKTTDIYSESTHEEVKDKLSPTNKLSSPVNIAGRTLKMTNAQPEGEEINDKVKQSNKLESPARKTGRTWKMADAYSDSATGEMNDQVDLSNKLQSPAVKTGRTWKKGNALLENATDEIKDKVSFNNTLESPVKKTGRTLKMTDTNTESVIEEINAIFCPINRVQSPIKKFGKTLKKTDEKSDEEIQGKVSLSNKLQSPINKIGKTWKIVDEQSEKVNEEIKDNVTLSNKLQSPIIKSGKTWKKEDAFYETSPDETKDKDYHSNKLQSPVRKTVRTWKIADDHSKNETEDTKDRDFRKKTIVSSLQENSKAWKIGEGYVKGVAETATGNVSRVLQSFQSYTGEIRAPWTLDDIYYYDDRAQEDCAVCWKNKTYADPIIISLLELTKTSEVEENQQKRKKTENVGKTNESIKKVVIPKSSEILKPISEANVEHLSKASENNSKKEQAAADLVSQVKVPISSKVNNQSGIKRDVQDDSRRITRPVQDNKPQTRVVVQDKPESVSTKDKNQVNSKKDKVIETVKRSNQLQPSNEVVPRSNVVYLLQGGDCIREGKVKQFDKKDKKLGQGHLKNHEVNRSKPQSVSKVKGTKGRSHTDKVSSNIKQMNTKLLIQDNSAAPHHSVKMAIPLNNSVGEELTGLQSPRHSGRDAKTSKSNIASFAQRIRLQHEAKKPKLDKEGKALLSDFKEVQTISEKKANDTKTIKEHNSELSKKPNRVFKTDISGDMIKDHKNIKVNSDQNKVTLLGTKTTDQSEAVTSVDNSIAQKYGSEIDSIKILKDTHEEMPLMPNSDQMLKALKSLENNFASNDDIGIENMKNIKDNIEEQTLNQKSDGFFQVQKSLDVSMANNNAFGIENLKDLNDTTEDKPTKQKPVRIFKVDYEEKLHNMNRNKIKDNRKQKINQIESKQTEYLTISDQQEPKLSTYLTNGDKDKPAKVFPDRHRYENRQQKSETKVYQTLKQKVENSKSEVNSFQQTKQMKHHLPAEGSKQLKSQATLKEERTKWKSEIHKTKTKTDNVDTPARLKNKTDSNFQHGDGGLGNVFGKKHGQGAMPQTKTPDTGAVHKFKYNKESARQDHSMKAHLKDTLAPEIISNTELKDANKIAWSENEMDTNKVSIIESTREQPVVTSSRKDTSETDKYTSSLADNSVVDTVVQAWMDTGHTIEKETNMFSPSTRIHQTSAAMPNSRAYIGSPSDVDNASELTPQLGSAKSEGDYFDLYPLPTFLHPQKYKAFDPDEPDSSEHIKADSKQDSTNYFDTNQQMDDRIINRGENAKETLTIAKLGERKEKGKESMITIKPYYGTTERDLERMSSRSYYSSEDGHKFIEKMTALSKDDSFIRHTPNYYQTKIESQYTNRQKRPGEATDKSRLKQEQQSKSQNVLGNMDERLHMTNKKELLQRLQIQETKRSDSKNPTAADTKRSDSKILKTSDNSKYIKATEMAKGNKWSENSKGIKTSENSKGNKITEYSRDTKTFEHSRSNKITEYSRESKTSEHSKGNKLRENSREAKTSQHSKGNKIKDSKTSVSSKGSKSANDTSQNSKTAHDNQMDRGHMFSYKISRKGSRSEIIQADPKSYQAGAKADKQDSTSAAQKKILADKQDSTSAAQKKILADKQDSTSAAQKKILADKQDSTSAAQKKILADKQDSTSAAQKKILSSASEKLPEVTQEVAPTPKVEVVPVQEPPPLGLFARLLNTLTRSTNYNVANTQPKEEVVNTNDQKQNAANKSGSSETVPDLDSALGSKDKGSGINKNKPLRNRSPLMSVRDAKNLRPDYKQNMNCNADSDMSKESKPVHIESTPRSATEVQAGELKTLHKNLKTLAKSGKNYIDSLSVALEWNAILLTVIFTLYLGVCCPALLKYVLYCPLPSIFEILYKHGLISVGVDALLINKAVPKSVWAFGIKRLPRGRFYTLIYQTTAALFRPLIYVTTLTYTYLNGPFISAFYDAFVSTVKNLMYLVSFTFGSDTNLGEGNLQPTIPSVDDITKTALSGSDVNNVKDVSSKLGELRNRGSIVFYLEFEPPKEGCDFSYLQSTYMKATNEYPPECL